MSGVKLGQQSGGAGLWIAFGRTKRVCFGIAIGLRVFLFCFADLIGFSSLTEPTLTGPVPKVGGVSRLFQKKYVYESKKLKSLKCLFGILLSDD